MVIDAISAMIPLIARGAIRAAGLFRLEAATLRAWMYPAALFQGFPTRAAWDVDQLLPGARSQELDQIQGRAPLPADPARSPPI